MRGILEKYLWYIRGLPAQYWHIFIFVPTLEGLGKQSRS